MVNYLLWKQDNQPIITIWIILTTEGKAGHGVPWKEIKQL